MVQHGGTTLPVPNNHVPDMTIDITVGFDHELAVILLLLLVPITHLTVIRYLGIKFSSKYG
jgi:hypothetical protein